MTSVELNGKGWFRKCSTPGVADLFVAEFYFRLANRTPDLIDLYDEEASLVVQGDPPADEATMSSSSTSFTQPSDGGADGSEVRVQTCDDCDAIGK